MKIIYIDITYKLRSFSFLYPPSVMGLHFKYLLEGQWFHWTSFHLVSPPWVKSIVRTPTGVFPNSIVMNKNPQWLSTYNSIKFIATIVFQADQANTVLSQHMSYFFYLLISLIYQAKNPGQMPYYVLPKCLCK